ncbi:36183_t:CDS:2, partial [Gigaspora margarita]
RRRNNNSRPVELFKLHLIDMSEDQKPALPEGLNYKKAITDYLSEAAAIYCMRSLKEFSRTEVGTSFLIVDIGGGTVDLTIRKLLPGNKLGEITEQTGDCCGGSFVDKEFINFLTRKVGKSAMSSLKENNYGLLQYMVQEFCRSAKIPFTGEKKDFKTFELDLEELCGFSESKYLRKRIKEEFKKKVSIISSPDKPIAAIVRGALLYGLDTAVVKSRVLRYTYGIRSLPDWQPGDPVNRRTPDGKIYRFHTLIQRGKKVEVNEEISDILRVAYADQIDMCMDIYVTRAYEAKYCDEPGVELLGKFTINIPDKHKGLD